MPNTSITLFVFFLKLIYRLTDLLKPNFNRKNIPQKQENKSFSACSILYREHNLYASKNAKNVSHHRLVSIVCKYYVLNTVYGSFTTYLCVLIILCEFLEWVI